MFKTSLSRVLFVRTQSRGRGVVFATLFITLALLVLGTIAALQNQQATAAPTSNLNFQARLKQSSGALVPDGYYHVEFKLYNQSSTGTALWTETYTGGSRVRVVNGYVSVSLGSVTPFPGTIDWGEEHWITMNVGGSGGAADWDGEMSPRLKLTAVPYAFKAAEAGSLKTTQGPNQSTLGWATQTQSRTLTLPDESGVLCVQSSTACGFAPATGGTGYIQNGTVVQPSTNFNISGTGQASTLNATTAIQLNGTDINTAGTLTNVAYLNQVTTFQAVTDDTNAFRVQNSTGGTILNVDTLGSTVSIGQSSTVDTLTKVGDPSTLVAGSGNDISWSSSGNAAIVGQSPANLVIYGKGTDSPLANTDDVQMANFAGTWYLRPRIYNASPFPVDIHVITPFGEISGANVAPGSNIFQSFSTRISASEPAPTEGTITIITKAGDRSITRYIPLPGGTQPEILAAAWSPDGKLLATAIDESPYVDGLGTVTPAAAVATDMAWSPDGQYLTLTHASSPYMTIYKRSGASFTKMPDLAVLPAGASNSVAWSPNGQYMSVAHATGARLTIYKRSGDTFTKLANPAELPGGIVSMSVAWSPDSMYMSVGGAGSDILTIYKRSGDTFTKLADPDVMPPDGAANSVAWSPDSRYMAIATADTPYIMVYKQAGDTFTKITDPVLLPVASGAGAKRITFSQDGTYVAVTHDGAPYVTTYKVGDATVSSVSASGDATNNAYFAGHIVSGSLVVNAIQAGGATFGSLAASNSDVQSLAVDDALTVGASITLAANDTDPGMLSLGVMASVSDPAGGADGAMYYNSTLGVFRCKIAGVWQTCGGLPDEDDTAYQQEGNAFDETAILGTTDNYGLQLITNGTQVANFTSSGDIIFTPGETFEIKNSTSATVLGVNTTDNTIDLNADVTTAGSVSITNGLTVAGNASFDSNLTVAGTTTMTNNLTVQNEDDENILNVNAATGVVTVGEANTLTWDGEVGILSAAVDVQPVGAARSAAWSEGGQYLAVAHTASPYVSIYKRSGNTFTKLADPAILPTGASYGVAWSPDGTYLSVTHNASPRLTIYKRSGDTFTKLANPAVIPSSNAYNSAWSGDGRYLAVTISASPDNLIIYKRSGDTFTKLANPAAVLLGNGRGVSFSPDSTYMVYTTASGADGERMIIYKRSGDTFTKLADPSGIPSSASTAWSATWSGDGVYLNVSHYGSPYLTTYKRSGDTFTKLADPSLLPTTGATTSAFSPSGQYLAVGNTWTPYFSMYKRSGDTFTKLPNPGTLPQSQVLGVAFSGDNNYVAVVGDGGAGNTADQRLRIYKSGGENGEVAGNLIIGATTTTDSLLIGNPASASLAGAKLVVTTAEIQTSLRLGNATSGISWNDITTGSGGGKLRLYGDSRNLRTITLTPEYAGAVLSGSGTGVMANGYDGTNGKSYYQWNATALSDQTYEVAVTFALPSDWSEWASGNAICVSTKLDHAANASARLYVLNSNNGGIDVNGPTISPTGVDVWDSRCYSLTSSNYGPNGVMVMRIAMTAKNSASLYLGDITLTYLSSF